MIEVDHDSPLPEIALGCVLSIGKFDGVHKGHQALAHAARRLADRRGTRCLALTFDPLPLTILRPELPLSPPLTPLDVKIQLLKETGFDDVAVFRTGRWLLDLDARSFFDRIVCDRFRAAGLAEGTDFSFGRNRSGDGKILAQWCEARGMDYVEVPAVIAGEFAITSSLVRKAIDQGELPTATNLMGHRFSSRGHVVRGAGRGRTIGIPTANLADIDTILPAPGVYAAAARRIDDGGEAVWRAAAVNLGVQPTFDSQRPCVEVHLIGEPDRNLYGERVELVWLERLRDIRKFGSPEALLTQIRSDIETSRSIFESEFGESGRANLRISKTEISGKKI